MKPDKWSITEKEVLVFDMDGTLYHQKGLRKRMLRELLAYYGPRPQRWGDLNLLRKFRVEREKLAGIEIDDLEQEQYRRIASSLGCDANRLQQVVDEWINQRPLRHLSPYVYLEVKKLIQKAREAGKTIVLFSDYPVQAKAESMGIKAHHYLDATQPEINALKPSTRGLEYVCNLTATEKEKVLMIGDRDDRDGESARKANIDYLIVQAETANETYRNLHQQITT